MTAAQPDWRTGKLCYVELPAVDPQASAAFYGDVFGWEIRRRDDGSMAFTDTVGAVSGAFVTGRAPQLGHCGRAEPRHTADAEGVVGPRRYRGESGVFPAPAIS